MTSLDISYQQTPHTSSADSEEKVGLSPGCPEVGKPVDGPQEGRQAHSSWPTGHASHWRKFLQETRHAIFLL